jgi:H+/Cl- antiporter ClcA
MQEANKINGSDEDPDHSTQEKLIEKESSDAFSKKLNEKQDDRYSVVEKAKAVSMPAVGKTFVFPREDNVFKGKESIPYDEVATQVWRERPKRRSKEHIREWGAYTMLGIGIGFTAFVMSTLEESLSALFSKNMQKLITGNENIPGTHIFAPWVFFAFMSGFVAMISGVMTTYYGPGAAGSGVAEYIGYCNGINYPQFISIPTLVTKVFGVTLAVVGRLCIGKEGPLAHIGAIIGVLTLYTPKLGFEFLQNDEKRRCLAAAGASAGVSVAFGAPIGGTLFSYEMSRPNTFWRFSMIWKVFMSCSIGTFSLAFF